MIKKHGRVTVAEGVPQNCRQFWGRTATGRTRPERQDPSKKATRRNSSKSYQIVVGRTIGERREKLETKNERIAARKKDKKKKVTRIVVTIIGFICLIAVLIVLYLVFFRSETSPIITPDPVEEEIASATIPIVDEGSNDSGESITARMKTYIAQMEQDLKSYGYHPVKAVVPSSSVREVDFYLEEYPGYIKTVIDRGAGVTAEDADRLLRHLAGQGITEFEYIDVRIDGKAYWK